jgi:hypothetical protein
MEEQEMKYRTAKGHLLSSRTRQQHAKGEDCKNQDLEGNAPLQIGSSMYS